MRKAFNYRLYPPAMQEPALADMLETHRRLYNQALAERQTAWEEEQRAVARKQKGEQSAQEGSATARQATPARRQPAPQLSSPGRASLIRQYGLIAHEALNSQGIARSRLAKSTHDVGWGLFLSILHSKAEGAGVQVLAVPPAHTTKDCSGCGERVDKTLSMRTHVCPRCGLIMDRDENAAQNILRLGRSLQASTWPTGACVA